MIQSRSCILSMSIKSFFKDFVFKTISNRMKLFGKHSKNIDFPIHTYLDFKESMLIEIDSFDFDSNRFLFLENRSDDDLKSTFQSPI